MEKIRQFLDNLQEKKVSLLTLFLSFLGILALRVFIEHFIAKSTPIAPFELIIEYIHDLYFFGLSFLLLWLMVAFFTREKVLRFSPIFPWGFLLIAFPPLIDMLKTQGAVFWSFYLLGGPSFLWNNLLSFFGALPSGIVYFGTKIVFFLAIFSLGALIFVRTKNCLRAILGIISAYLILFFMGAFPSLFFYFYNFCTNGKSIFKIQNFDVALLFGTSRPIFGISSQALKYTFVYNLNFIFFPLLILLLAIFFFVSSRQKFWAVVKNARFPQIIYHSGLLTIGLGLGYLNYPQNFHLSLFSLLAVLILFICVWLSWIASVIFNDIYDFKIDVVSNPHRPLQRKIFAVKEYAHLGIFLFLLSLIGALSLGFSFAALLLAYQFIAWLYSAPPYRLKKFPLVATLVSALALLLIFFAGYILMSSDQTIHTLSWRIILLLAITFTLSLPIKDFKDIAGDKTDGIWTLPVIFGEKKARLVVAINVFVSYILSVFFLNELRLFWWALLFGAFSFLVITNEKIKAGQLLWPVLGLIFLYGIILVKIVFL